MSENLDVDLQNPGFMWIGQLRMFATNGRGSLESVCAGQGSAGGINCRFDWLSQRE